MGFLNFAKAEGTETHLGQDTIVQDLDVHQRLLCSLLQVGQVQQVSSLLEVVVECEVIGLHQQGTTLGSDLA
eukprot:CAMPEP_0194774814 /NCGR_PEP_ID=MMETSP0323_2-20130528/58610_1 /TAXON_ID=2866 ORGANISM="Crypthecodinium cohnii, Strain Seligo" /NCGR_SAMPLE_ID=MMETSP0323_2 /ASSEMBLY_ACC=CAM_ASM_000346 /LENGTH=71 /DNA_ID=CAMNT_0039710511 /DNA_START=34 /DNA_END=245 /DNA_ORIENTATION=+